MPYAFVFYDIPDDRLRNKVANVLKDFGLRRLQKSVFEGNLTYNRGDELAKVIDRVMGDEEGDIRIIFVPPSFLDKIIVIREMYVHEEDFVVIK